MTRIGKFWIEIGFRRCGLVWFGGEHARGEWFACLLPWPSHWVLLRDVYHYDGIEFREYCLPGLFKLGWYK